MAKEPTVRGKYEEWRTNKHKYSGEESEEEERRAGGASRAVESAACATVRQRHE